MKRFRLEYRIFHRNGYSEWIELPVTPEGHIDTPDIEEARKGLRYWECHLMSGTFRLMCWEATKVE